jgi:hypothetical protein
VIRRPCRWKRSLARAFQGDEDGMYGRFLFGWPSTPPYRRLTNEVAEIEPELQSALKALIRLPAEDAENVFVPQVIPLSQTAVEAFEDYRQHVDQSKRALDGIERQWLVKSESQVLRLAGALTYLTWAFSLGVPSAAGGLAKITAGLEPTEVGEKAMAAAIRLVREYFWPHARASLRQIGLSDRHRNARRVMRWVAAHRKQEVSREDIRRGALGQSLDAEQTQDLLNTLERAGWLRKAAPKGPQGGRPQHRWEVNPNLLDGTAESAESAETYTKGCAAQPIVGVSAVRALSAPSSRRSSSGNGGADDDCLDIPDFLDRRANPPMLGPPGDSLDDLK